MNLLDWKSRVQRREVKVTTAYVVKTGKHFLCSAEDGDIGLAPDIKEAKSFPSQEEAQQAADTHADPGYEILTISLPAR